ncbi:uncharacterized protein LOC107048276 [Diachasma alloeum]|uniref:uncharacterized protein LOC107048276 n=1 Tax=Diachasma alloeum TaxID=454923 RepID=UPI0007384AE5|nr:uncharacterized protein LOC107048276 [Diachasma alloeum]
MTNANANLKSWTPAVSAKHPDNIVSSEFTTAKIFRPSYEKEEPCMEQLMANEYQRMWLTERDEWLSKTILSNEEKKKRRQKGANSHRTLNTNDKSKRTVMVDRITMSAGNDSQPTHSKREERP